MFARRIFFLLAMLAAGAAAFPANVTVPNLELYTLGSVEDGDFGFTSRGEMDLLVEGGYKFSGKIELDFLSPVLEQSALSDSSGLTFKSASIQIRQILDLPLDFTYFIGEGATFCSGDLFPEQFGTLPLATRYRGFLYFPHGTIYDGIHTLNGTGFHMDYSPRKETVLWSFFLYQDSMVGPDGDPNTFEPGYYSTDFRVGLNFEKIKVETFLGGTYPTPQGGTGYLRGGLLFYAVDEGVEFLAQLGIPRWAPLEESFDMDFFYLLFEPRAHFGLLSIIPTFFWRPAYYQQQYVGDEAFSVNLNFQLGRIPLQRVIGGLEGDFTYQTERDEEDSDFSVKISPYLQVAMSGVFWELKVNATVWPYNIDDLLECFIVVKAEF